jgi:hypothetical protein
MNDGCERDTPPVAGCGICGDHDFLQFFHGK